MITASLDGRTLALRGDTFAARDGLKAAGARWHAPSKTWRLPATLDAARAAVDLGAELMDGAQALLATITHAPVPWPAGVTPGWDHQLTSFRFAIARGGTLFNVALGAGKTLITLALLRAWGCQRILVGCPLSVVDVWAREAEKHAPGMFHVKPLRGPVDARAEQLKQLLRLSHPVIAVTNYDAVWRGKLGKLVADTVWDAAVADESFRLKSPGAKSSRFFGRLNAAHRLALTGTPLGNSPLDAYGQMRFLDPTIFGTSFVAFRSRYAVLGGFGNHQVLALQNMDEFKERMGRATITITREDARLSLPPETDQTVTVELSPKARKAYEEMRRHMVALVKSGEVTASNALVRSLRLAQLANGAAQADGRAHIEVIDTAKREALKDLLEGTAERVVVFCRFVADLRVVELVANELNRSYGEISGSRKDALDDRAEMAAEVQVAGVQLQAGGLGIDLVRASIGVYMGLSWSAADYAQSRARLHRPGQRRPVTFVHIVARDTIDQAIHRAIERKLDVAAEIMAHFRR